LRGHGRGQSELEEGAGCPSSFCEGGSWFLFSWLPDQSGNANLPIGGDSWVALLGELCARRLPRPGRGDLCVILSSLLGYSFLGFLIAGHWSLSAALSFLLGYAFRHTLLASFLNGAHTSSSATYSGLKPLQFRQPRLRLQPACAAATGTRYTPASPPAAAKSDSPPAPHTASSAMVNLRLRKERPRRARQLVVEIVFRARWCACGWCRDSGTGHRSWDGRACRSICRWQTGIGRGRRDCRLVWLSWEKRRSRIVSVQVTS